MAKEIYKQAKTYWIRYAGLDGKIVYESSGSERFDDAKTILIDRKKAIRDGKQPEVKKIENHTFRELAEEYSHWMQGRHRSANTKMYRIKDLLSTFGSLTLRKFSTLLVEQYQTDLLNKNLKPASVNKNISLLKAMIKKAVDWEMVEESMLKEVRAVKLFPENNRRLRFLSKAECQGLINSCYSHLKAIVITALNTGIRRGEVLNLTWEQVDMKHGFILLDIQRMVKDESPHQQYPQKHATGHYTTSRRALRVLLT